MIVAMLSGFLGLLLSGLVGPQPVAGVSFVLAVVGCLVAGIGGFVWFSHFIFLTYLGGLLVLFLYSTALAPCPGKLASFRPGFGFDQFWWYVVGVVSFWVVAGGWFSSSRGKWSVSVVRSEVGGVYDDHDWSVGMELVDFAWLAGWVLPALGCVLFLCMVSVTKICGGVGVSMRRVTGGPEVLRSAHESRFSRRRPSSFSRLVFPFRSLDEVPLYRNK